MMTIDELRKAKESGQLVYALKRNVVGQTVKVQMDYGRVTRVFYRTNGDVCVELNTTASSGQRFSASEVYPTLSELNSALRAPKPGPSWADAEARVYRAIKDLADAPASIDCNNPWVDKYRAILDAELRLLELRVKVELAEIGQADRDRVMSKLAE